jgi:hypothetical protein
VSFHLLDDSRAAKHGRDHDRRHPDTVVGVDVRAVFEQEGRAAELKIIVPSMETRQNDPLRILCNR